MTNQTPVERAAEAMRRDNCPCEHLCYCSDWHREAHLAFESIDTDIIVQELKRQGWTCTFHEPDTDCSSCRGLHIASAKRIKRRLTGKDQT